MNQEFLVKTTRWIFYGSVGVLVVAIFFVFFGDHNGRERGAGNKNWATLGMPEGISSRMGGGMNADSVGNAGAGAGLISAPDTGMEPVPSAKMIPQEVQMFSEEAIDSTGVSSPDKEQRVVRSGSLSIRVEDAKWSADEIDRIAMRFGGFTASRSFSSDIPSNGISGYPMPLSEDVYDKRARVSVATMPQSGLVVVKVPSSKFGEAISAIRGVATVVLNESSSASDVSAQFADLETRIKNKYAEEAAFIKILNTTSGKVSDILEVTRELSRVRGEIEQLETQKKYMESQTDMAEISVSLSEDASVGAATNTWRPWQTVKAAVNRLLVQCQSFVDGVIYFAVSVLPFFLLYLVGLYVMYRVGRKVYRKVRGQ